jgi:hypothetical protein
MEITMAQRYNTGNQRPSNSMKDLNDNALAYDDFLNGDADEVIDRLGKSMPTIRKTIRDANDKFHSQITLQDSLFLNSQIDKENRFASFLDSSGYVFWVITRMARSSSVPVTSTSAITTSITA